MKRFKSVSRAIRRGHLRINYKPVVVAQSQIVDKGNVILGSNLVVEEPKVIQVPYIERRTSTNKRKWIPY